MRCIDCGMQMTVKRENYRYDECGLPYVVLEDVQVSRCEKCGCERVSIPALEQLHELIARTVASKKSRLLSAEVKFLRKYLGYSGQDFAEIMGVSGEAVSKWENERQNISPPAERLLRVLVFQNKPASSYPIDCLRHIDRMKADPVRVEVKHEQDIWESVNA